MEVLSLERRGGNDHKRRKRPGGKGEGPFYALYLQGSPRDEETYKSDPGLLFLIPGDPVAAAYTTTRVRCTQAKMTSDLQKSRPTREVEWRQEWWGTTGCGRITSTNSRGTRDFWTSTVGVALRVTNIPPHSCSVAVEPGMCGLGEF